MNWILSHCPELLYSYPMIFILFSQYTHLLVRFTQGMDGLLGVAGMIIDNSPMDHSRKFPAYNAPVRIFRQPRRQPL